MVFYYPSSIFSGIIWHRLDWNSFQFPRKCYIYIYISHTHIICRFFIIRRYLFGDYIAQTRREFFPVSTKVFIYIYIYIYPSHVQNFFKFVFEYIFLLFITNYQWQVSCLNHFQTFQFRLLRPLSLSQSQTLRLWTCTNINISTKVVVRLFLND